MQALFAGEGNARDSFGANDGTLQNGANFALGKVGQAFNFDGVDDYVSVPDGGSLNITGDITVEGWIYPTSGGGRIVSKFDGVNIPYVLALGNADSNGNCGFVFYGTDTSGNYFTLQSTTVTVPLNQWSYVGFSWNSSGLIFYANGAAQNAADIPVRNRTAANSPTTIGATLGTNGLVAPFNGKIDELSLYNRGLSISELQAIYEAGKLGKIKQQSFTNQTSVQLAAATINFPSAQSGTAQEYAIDGVNLPAVPSGTPKLYYEVEATSATNGASVCFDVSALAANFRSLKVYHLENNVWVNRTTTGGTSPNLCTSALPSFSPFAVAQDAPTAAPVSISGRVMTSDGYGIRNASVILTLTNGVSRSVLTTAFGYFRLNDVEGGQTGILSVRAKRYTFSQNSQAVNLNNNLVNLDFYADGSSNFK